MATQMKRTSEWVGNAVFYVMGNPNRKSYPRNSKGFEQLDAFFPPKKPESDSDSDSGTEELIQERYQRRQEARQRKRAQEGLAKEQGAQRESQMRNGHHIKEKPDASSKSPAAVETLQASHLDREITVSRTKDDTFTKSAKDDTFTKSTTIVQETSQGKESIVAESGEPIVTQGKELELTQDRELTMMQESTMAEGEESIVTQDSSVVTEGKESTMTLGRGLTVPQDKGSEGTKLSVTDSEQLYSPESSVHHSSPPSQHKRLQPSRLTFDEDISPEPASTKVPAPVKPKQPAKRKKSQSVSMPNKRKSAKPQHHPPTTQPDPSPTTQEAREETTSPDPTISTREPDTETTISFNPPISSTLNSDQAVTEQKSRKLKPRKHDISSIRPLKKFIETLSSGGETEDRQRGSQADDTLHRLFKGAVSKMESLKATVGLSEDEAEKTAEPVKKSAGKAEKSILKKRSGKAGKNTEIEESGSLPREPDPVPSDSDEEQTVKRQRKSTRKSVAAKLMTKSHKKDPTPIESEGEQVANTRRKSTRKSVAPKLAVEHRKSQRKTAASALLTDKSILTEKSQVSNIQTQYLDISPPRDTTLSKSPPMVVTPHQKSQYGIKRMSLVLTKTTSPRSPYSSEDSPQHQTTKEPGEKTQGKATEKGGAAKRKSSRLAMPKKVRAGRKQSTPEVDEVADKNTTKTATDGEPAKRRQSSRKSTAQTEASDHLPKSTSSSSVDTGLEVLPSIEPVDQPYSDGGGLSGYEDQKAVSKSAAQSNVDFESGGASSDKEESGSPIDKSVLPRIRKRKKQGESILPKKRHKQAPRAPEMSDSEQDLDMTTSPGGREYRRMKVAGGLSKTPGVRRSQRTRIAPVRSWLNEKVEYEMRRKSGVSLKGLLVPMYPIEAAPIRKRPHTRKKSTGQEPAAVDEDFDKLTISYGSDQEEEWTVVKTKESAPKVDTRGVPATELTDVIVSRLHTNSYFTSGILTLKPLAMKESSKSNTFQMMFHVTSGKLLFQVNHKDYVVQRGMTVHVPPSSLYSIRNVQTDEAEAFYFTHNIAADTSQSETSSSVSSSIES